MILYIFLGAMSLRFISLYVSYSNEKHLKATGLKEHGKYNTIVLTLLHLAIYLAAIKESLYYNKTVNDFTYAGVVLFLLSMLVLLFTIFKLGNNWSIKLIIPGKESIPPIQYRNLRRVNYFLNVIPELIAITLICQAWLVLSISLPIYTISLAIRIFQEAKQLKNQFPES